MCAQGTSTQAARKPNASVRRVQGSAKYVLAVMNSC